MLLTGFPAGGVGSTVTCGIVRDAMQPLGRRSLIADPGPLTQAPRSGTPEQYPSLPLHTTIRSAWGLDDPGGLIALYAGSLPGFDPDNLGSVNGALADKYPNRASSTQNIEQDHMSDCFRPVDPALRFVKLLLKLLG